MKVNRYVKDFNLQQIFDCGQCFRWEREADGSYTGIAFGKPVNISLEETASLEGMLTVDNTTESDFEMIWHPYLDLGRDYGPIKHTLAQSDAVMADVIRSGSGIRILNQDKWETVVSFLISQNSNIPRIKRCIETLACMFGTEAGEYAGRTFYELPAPEVLATLTVSDLEPVKLGYRAAYLIETAKAVAADDGEILARTGDMPFEEAYTYLTGLHGIGPKVAHCILLFSMGKTESFPIDVWIRRVMHHLYGFAERDAAGIRSFAAETFGGYGGIAQQYLFYYMRDREGKNFQ
mgnify:CR=1 FL=1